MNVATLASRFIAEKTAGNAAPKAAKPDRPAASAAAIVTLSGADRPAASPTYVAPQAVVSPPPATNLLDQPLLLPTRENVAKLAKAAADTLNEKLDQAGIPREPGFELEIADPNSAHVTVKSDRPDAKAIEALVNGDPQLQMTLHNAEAIASHIPAIERSMAYQQEYRAAQTQQQIDQVNSRYADLLSGHSPAADIGLYYDKSGIQVTINRQPVNPST